MEALGYRQNNICYIHCSLDCANAAIELIPSLELGLVSSTISDLEAMARVNPQLNPNITDLVSTNNQTGASVNPVSVFNSSTAIENCFLADAKSRLDRDKISKVVRFKNLKEIANLDIRWN
jgi:hypothetical protein